MNNRPENETSAATPSGDVMMALIGAARVVEDRLETALAPHGLSLPKLNVLNKLADAERPLSLSEIAARVACVRSNVTQLVDRLEADGLVRREPDSTDRRSILAVLTEQGREKQRVGEVEVQTVRSSLAQTLAAHDPDALEKALMAIP